MIGSLAELVSMPGMPSEPTLRKLIAENEDFPVLSRGKNGQAYEFDLVEAAKYVRRLRERDEEIARERAKQVRQLGLDLLGPDHVVAPEQVGMSPAERRALMEEEYAATKLAALRGELVRKATVEAAIVSVLSLIAKQGKSFSGRLSKRTDLTRDQINLIDKMMKDDLTALANKLEEMGKGVIDVASVATGDPVI